MNPEQQGKESTEMTLRSGDNSAKRRTASTAHIEDANLLSQRPN